MPWTLASWPRPSIAPVWSSPVQFSQATRAGAHDRVLVIGILADSVFSFAADRSLRRRWGRIESGD